ncbi:hypothetical protein CDD81_1375 [Ophiocordyceps australis]|uniref:Chitin-binding type-4 domain-containing protein n=1 Tax=Ophiocordyceps australis TaxID=1399860 RepID=A0A2C5Y113_9HYPO|nr:hypothetical protein CDD81_1375 [Ophiocordyceps australis]
MLVKLFAVSGLVAIGNAHMVMTNPAPYGESSLTNGPLAADGSDFPCKQRSNVYDAEGASNVYKQGSSQQLTFKGSAVHGGGSCQLSVTKDLKPTKSSVWKVIKSIEGGCPAKGQVGNMAGGAGAANPYKYDFEIPQELAAGNYTLAWTWFNRVGNREMYMNCAPMSVTGSGGSEGFMDSLPDMFVANVGNDCKTKDNDDVEFPDAGAATDLFGQSAPSPPQGAGCKASSGKKSSGSKSSPKSDASVPTSALRTSAVQTSAFQTSAAEASETPDYSEPAVNAEVPGGVFMSVASSQAPAATSAPAATPASSQQAAAPTQAALASSNNSQSAGHAAGSACSVEGSWNCIGGSTFQRCGSGSWSAPMHLPEGITCSPGEGSEISMNTVERNVVKRASRRSLRPAA